MKTIKLPTDVAQQFELVNWTGGHRQNFGKFGVVDLEKLTVRRAESLVKQGFSKLQKKEADTKSSVAKKN